MQEYKKPPCLVNEKNKIGSGGNGKVGFVVGHEKDLAIKIFSVSKNLHRETRDRRYKRFCREIIVQRDLSADIVGVLPVLDFSFPEVYSAEKPVWYTMPRAEKFVLYDDVTLLAKLQRMLELAKILKSLHGKGMAHRDLKPDNLLMYKGKIHLADYGLVWLAGENMLTPPTEPLGPIKILPPELEEREGILQCEYEKSDVYLFAKVIWMYINEDNFGYRGEYSRTDPQRRLRTNKNYGKTLEPLHLLMEKCSKHNWSDRPSIEECMELIEHQIMILTGELSEEKEREYAIKERMALYQTNVKPDVEVYESEEKIISFMRDMVKSMKLKIEMNGRTFLITPYSVRMLQGRLIAFSQEVSEGHIKKYAMHIHRLEISNEKINFFMRRFNEQEREMAESLKAEKFDGNYKGEIILD